MVITISLHRLFVFLINRPVSQLPRGHHHRRIQPRPSTAISAPSQGHSIRLLRNTLPNRSILMSKVRRNSVRIRRRYQVQKQYRRPSLCPISTTMARAALTKYQATRPPGASVTATTTAPTYSPIYSRVTQAGSKSTVK